jgi:hypothetical protein
MSYDGGGGREAGKRVRGCPNAEVSYVLPFFTATRESEEAELFLIASAGVPTVQTDVQFHVLLS